MGEKLKPPTNSELYSYLLAVAILTPIGMWLKAHYAYDLGAWTLSWFH